MAITQLSCPKCNTKIYVSVTGKRDPGQKQCPRCDTMVDVYIDDDAKANLEEERIANAKRTGTAADERFAAIVEKHSREVDDVIGEIRENYRIEMQKIEAQSDIPTLEHVKEDIDDALKYIEEDSETFKKIMTVGRRTPDEEEGGKQTIRGRVRNAIETKVIDVLAGKFFNGDADDAKVIYDLSRHLLQRYGQGSITRKNLIDEALAMELDEHQMQVIYNLLDNGRFGEILAIVKG